MESMEFVFPDYYKDFRCIAGDCRHSCCIGWEIDIDEDSLAFFESVPGEFGDRLRQNISKYGDAHFVLGEGERCPFLNRDNLCDIILTLGEEHICGICTDHPRFRNELPGRVETGLGLCCEEAARLILSKKEPVQLIVTGEKEEEDEIVSHRDKVLSLLQNRQLSIAERIEAMLTACDAELPEMSISQWAQLLLDLERLDEEWTKYLVLLRDKGENADFAGFDEYMKDRQTEYEQLLVYLVYRHMANASDYDGIAARAGFAAVAYIIIYTLGAALWTERGEFSPAQQTELARLFSSEIEYSDNNRYAILDVLEEALWLQ